MKPLSLTAAAGIAGFAAVRRRRLGRGLTAVAVLAAAVLLVNGLGLIHLPNLEDVTRDAGSALGAFTYPVVGLAAFLETGAGIGLIAPGELLVVLGGVTAGQGVIEIVPLVLIVWVCAVLGDLTSFILGRRLGRGFIVAHGPKLGLSEKRIEQVERFYARHGGKTIVLGRFLGLFRALSPFLAGASHMPLRRFLPLTALAAGIWSALFCALGYVFWRSFDHALALARQGTLALVALIGVSVLVTLLVRALTTPQRRQEIRRALTRRPTGRRTIRLRTWLWVAALTALVTTAGAVLGGVPLWICTTLAAAVNLGGWWVSDRIALRAVRAEAIPVAQTPAFHATARDLARRAGIPTPRLMVMPGERPNAFATGRSPSRAAVALTVGLLRDLDAEQIRGVLAHEFAHIKHRDVLVSSLAATVAGMLSAAVGLAALALCFGGQNPEPLWIIGAVIATVLTPVAAMLVQLGVSRDRELRADRAAAEILGTGRPLADAFETIEALRWPPRERATGAGPTHVIRSFSGPRARRLLTTHPPVRQRIRRLDAIDRDARRRRRVAPAAR